MVNIYTGRSPAQRRAIGVAVLEGLSCPQASLQYGIHFSTAERYAKDIARELVGAKAWIEANSRPGIGPVTAAREIWRTRNQAAPPVQPEKISIRMQHSTAYLRHWNGQPQLIIEHGCDGGAAYIVGHRELLMLVSGICDLLI